MVISTLPTGNVGANESPLKLESDGAVSSNENLKEAGGVVSVKISRVEIGKRRVRGVKLDRVAGHLARQTIQSARARTAAIVN